MKGFRKVFVGLVYLLGMFAISALEIWRHDKPDLTGMGLLASGLALGVGTVMWGNAKEHEHEASKQGEPGK